MFELGVLEGIIQAISYIFEMPSGIIADQCGKKNELLLCFVFYIISFGESLPPAAHAAGADLLALPYWLANVHVRPGFYFMADPALAKGAGFPMLVAASVSYGLGEAFRSGTHKAMIMQWLDKEGYKAYVLVLVSRAGDVLMEPWSFTHRTATTATAAAAAAADTRRSCTRARAPSATSGPPSPPPLPWPWCF